MVDSSPPALAASRPIVQQPTSQDWVLLTDAALDPASAISWATIPSCGGLVCFAGTVRDHAEGRPGVSELEYEAYASQVEPRLAAITEAARRRWSGLGRIAIWHRTGTLAVTECSVVVVVSAAHRDEAFEASRYCIDAVKRSVPIWKRETWRGGQDWGTCAHDLEHVALHQEAGA